MAPIRKLSLEAGLLFALPLLLGGAQLEAAPRESREAERVKSALAVVAVVHERVTVLVSEIEAVAAASEVSESDWQRLHTRSRSFQATLPTLGEYFSGSLRVLRAALASRRQAWSGERDRVRRFRKKLRSSLGRLAREDPKSKGGEASIGAAANERHRKSLRVTGAGVTGRLEALLGVVSEREAARSRQLEELDALSFELDRVVRTIEVYFGVLENELPAVDRVLEAGRDVFRPEILDRLKILGMHPRELVSSLEEVHARILEILRL